MSSIINTPLLDAVRKAQAQRQTSMAASDREITQFIRQRASSNLGASRFKARSSLPSGSGIAGGSSKGGLASFLNAIASVESGGNYNATNSIGALGKYQILSSNVPGWSREALGHSITPSQFLNSPKLQEAIARYKLGQYVSKYGYAGAASAWNSGRATPPSDAVRAYVQKVMSRMR